MAAAASGSGRAAWIHRVGPIGALVVPLVLLYSFFTAGDYGESASSLIAYADENKADLWITQILGLAAPVLVGLFVASLVGRLEPLQPALRVLVVVGGTLFAAFLATGLTLWSAPLLSADELTNAGAEAYLAFDDVGWLLLGLAGVSMALLIVGATLAARDRGWLPAWAGWVSIALGVVSLATVAAVGLFAWCAWLLAAGVFLLFGRDRDAEEAAAPAA